MKLCKEANQLAFPTTDEMLDVLILFFFFDWQTGTKLGYES